MTWKRITDPDEAASLLPAWLGSRMIGLRGRFGLVLTTGDVLRITSIGALHQSPTGIVPLDVLLDRGGIPDGIDLAWQPKHYLGPPVPGATVATVNLAHVVAAVEFLAEETVEQPSDAAVLRGEEVEVGPAQGCSLAETIERANGESPRADWKVVINCLNCNQISTVEPARVDFWIKTCVAPWAEYLFQQTARA